MSHTPRYYATDITTVECEVLVTDVKLNLERGKIWWDGRYVWNSGVRAYAYSGMIKMKAK